MTTIQNLVVFILQLTSTYLLLKRRVSKQKISPNTTSQTRSSNERKSQIKRKIESRLFINSLVLFILMTIKTISYVMSVLQLEIFGVDCLTLYTYSADIFTLINPFLLLFVSDIVREMFLLFLTGKKYQL